MLSALLSIVVAALPTAPPAALPNMPEAVTSFGAVLVDEHVYVYGGHSGMAHHYSTAHHSYHFASLKLSGAAWTDLPFDGPVQGFGFVAHGGHLYRLGGSQAQNDPDEEEELISLDLVRRYDVAKRTWEGGTPLPEPRSSFNAAVINNHVYVAGGWRMPSEGEKEWLASCWRADLRRWPLSWERIADLPDRRRAHEAVAVGDLLILIGGIDEDGTSNAVSILDTATMTWRPGADFPAGGRMKGFGVAACVIGGQVFANGFDGAIHRYDADSDAWHETEASLDTRRFFHRLIATDDALLALGGATMGTHVATIERVERAALKDAAVSNNWRGFRDAGRSVARGPLPARWSPGEGIAWRTTVPGIGQSSPVIWDGRVIVASVEGDEQEQCHVHAYNLADGRPLWKRTLPATQKQKNDYSVARAASSPVVDKTGVYVCFPGGALAALTHAGDVRWQRTLVEEFGEIENRHGLGSSLAQTDGHIFVLVDDTGPAYLLAVDKADGQTAWRKERTPRRSWTSPVVIDAPDGKPAVVVSSNGAVDCYDAATGALLWNVPEISGNTIASATPVDGRILIGAGPMRGGVDAGQAAANNRLLRPTADGGVETVWKAEKAVTHYASPLAYRDCVYFVNRVGVLYCLDLASGRQHFAERLETGECWATPVAAGDYIYFFGKAGMSAVIEAGPAFKPIATNTIFGEQAPAEADDENRFGDLTNSLYGVAVSDGRIVLRTGSELICVGGPGVDAADEAAID